MRANHSQKIVVGVVWFIGVAIGITLSPTVLTKSTHVNTQVIKTSVAEFEPCWQITFGINWKRQAIGAY